ncbi:MAG: protein kinase [Candidatus Omnitrophica bacterium]|nr:protein kinase [Candidatus Omnitrophota bacterium]
MEKEIGKFKIQREIGKGGMAVVYKGVNAAGKVAAIKVLLQTMVDPSMVGRFNREAAAVQRLKHPNIIEVYEVGASGGSHYIAMEYVEGDNLKTLIKNKGRFSVDQTLSIIVQVADVLAYAHKELMYHRDIKPANIMITNQGVVKVMDFGLVKLPGVTKLTATGSSMGTPEYMSPEQIDGDQVDSRTDIYALGVTMYEMLTGRTPFQGESFQAIFQKHKQEAPPPMSTFVKGIPPEVERITLKAMAKNLGERYQRADDLISDIKAFVAKAPENKESATVIMQGATRVVPGTVPDTVPGTKRFPMGLIVIAVIGALAVYFVPKYKDEIRLYSEEYIEKAKSMILGEKDLMGEVERHLKVLEQAEEKVSQAEKLMSIGEVDQAIYALKKAIMLRPDHAPYYRELALALEKKGKTADARKAWQSVVKYDDTGRLRAEAQERLG